MKLEIEVPEKSVAEFTEKYANLRLSMEVLARCPDHHITVIVAVEEDTQRGVDCFNGLCDRIALALMSERPSEN